MFKDVRKEPNLMLEFSAKKRENFRNSLDCAENLIYNVDISNNKKIQYYQGFSL